MKNAGVELDWEGGQSSGVWRQARVACFEEFQVFGILFDMFCICY